MIGEATSLGLDPLRLRRRPYLHLDPEAWEGLRDSLAESPTEAFRNCHFGAAIVEAAAFVAAVTGDSADLAFLQAHLDRLLPSRGMAPVGLARGSYLAACAWAVDVLPGVLDAPAYDALRRTLADQARRLADELHQRLAEPFAWEDAELVGALAGLNLAGLALAGEEPDALRWLAISDPRLDDILAHVATDGWWPTGFEDWNALLPLLVRVADAWQRLADRDRFGCGLFREAARVALHGLAPSEVDALDFDCVGRPDLSRRQADAGGRPGAHYRWRNEPCRWALERLALRFEEPVLRAAIRRWQAAGLGRGSPWEVLWGRPGRGRKPTAGQPHHCFAAHGLAVWRSHWETDAMALALATGPAAGRSADASPLWRPGRSLAADANHWLLFDAGEPLVIDAGAGLANVVQIDGQGQRPPADRGDAGAGLTSCWLSDLGGYLTGQAGGCYPPELGLQTYDRHLAFAPGYVLLWDVLEAQRPVKFEWRLHALGAWRVESESQARLTQRRAGLLLRALRPARCVLGAEDLADRAHRLTLTPPQAVARTEFLVLLAPAGLATPAPRPTLMTDEATVGVRLEWPDGDSEEVLFPTRGRGITQPALLADVAWLALRRRPDGDWRRLLAARALRVLIAGGEVLTATQPVDVALAAGEWEVNGAIDSPTGATVAVRCPFPPRGVMIDGVSGRARLEREAQLAIVRLTAGRHQVWISGR